MSQFDDLEFSVNSDPRAPVAIVLDCSDSMMQLREGETQTPFQALNGGLDVLWTELHKDPLAKRRAEVSFIPFGSTVADPTPFKTVEEMVLPDLQPMGVTSLGAAVNAALDALEARKAEYKSNGIQYYRAQLIIITDGLPTDDISAAAARSRELAERGSVSVFGIGVEGADLDVLGQFSNRPGLMLKGMNFESFFQWLSASQSAVSASQVGDKVALPSPAGWAEL